MQKKSCIIATVGLLALSACGDTLLEQGLLGAGAGAGAAIVLGGSAATGVIVGASANIYCQNYSSQC